MDNTGTRSRKALPSFMACCGCSSRPAQIALDHVTGAHTQGGGKASIEAVDAGNLEAPADGREPGTVNGPPLHRPIILNAPRIPRISSENLPVFSPFTPFPTSRQAATLPGLTAQRLVVGCFVSEQARRRYPRNSGRSTYTPLRNNIWE